MMSPDRIRALREIYAEWLHDMHTIDLEDREAHAALTNLTMDLVGFLPTLLDEIEQLQAERTEGGRPRVRTFVKPDRMGGRA